jgi:hypothetical protein
MASGCGLSLPATMRMIDRVHYNTAHCWPDTPPALRPRLTDRTQIVFLVTYLPDGGPAIDMNLAYFPRAQSQLRVVALPGKKLD